MMIEVKMTLGKRWRIFLDERFPLLSHIPMALVLAAANVGFAARSVGERASITAALAGFALTFIFLLRLRCFDEIKDYAVDVRLNPERPLPRGVLTVRQVKIAIILLALCEISIAASFGWESAVTQLAAIGYSFLMYREFFIGGWLRPRLTLYAVTHTFSSVLLGWSLASLATGLGAWNLPSGILLLFGLANWMLFNVFEFARKTFSPSEEIHGDDSYSSLYGSWGAAALTLSQAVVALVALWLMPRTVISLGVFQLEMALAIALAIAGLAYAIRPTIGTAKLYRAVASFYLLGFYAVLVWGTW